MTKLTHVSTSNDFAWLPVISANGRYLATAGYDAVYAIDPSALHKTGPLLIDLQTGMAHAVTLPKGATDATPPRLLGVGADGTVLFSDGFYADSIAPHAGLYDGFYVGKTDDLPAAPLSVHADGMLKLTPVQGTLSADGMHAVVNAKQWDNAGNAVAMGVFEVDLRSGAVIPVNTTTEGLDMFPSLLVGGLAVSADGGVAAFSTTVFDAATGQTRIETQAWNVATHAKTLVSAATDGMPANGYTGATSVSGNGRYVAFESGATNLAPDAGNGLHNIVYVKDLATGAIRSVSADTAGHDVADSSLNLIAQAVSNDGRYVLFQSTNAYGFDSVIGRPPAGQDRLQHVFVKDMQTGAIALVNAAPETVGLEAHGAAISGDGSTIVFQGMKAPDAASPHREFQTWTMPLPAFAPDTAAAVLNGSGGADTLAGGLGDDTYTVNHKQDIVVEYADAGIDTVHATVSYTLPDNVENLTLDGAQRLDAAGNALANTLLGNAGDNHLLGGAGDDLIAGSGGLDIIDGGDGRDTVRFNGNLAAWKVKGGANVFVAQVAGGHDTALLVSVERLQFDDAVVTFDTGGINGQMYRLYQAAFDRTPDPGGLGFWLYQREHGASPASVSADFVKSDEFVRLFGAQATNEHLVDGLYQHVLHRAPDAGGKAYWIDLLDRHVVDGAYVLERFSESPENVAAVIGVMQNGIAYVPYGG